GRTGVLKALLAAGANRGARTRDGYTPLHAAAHHGHHAAARALLDAGADVTARAAHGPCCYDYPCKADCFNHGGATRPSGRYARTFEAYIPRSPGMSVILRNSECFHPCPRYGWVKGEASIYYKRPHHAATTTHAGLIALTTAPALAPADATLAPSGTQESAAPSCLLAKPSAVPTPHTTPVAIILATGTFN
ncbi:hypothetical protein MSG28_011495, partial [Choristoneura fumiferana]